MFSKTLFTSIVLVWTATQALAAGVKYAGVNIAGFDFGCVTDGTCDVSKVYGPVQSLATSDTASGAGPGQMSHFVKNDKLNMFRLPIAWQYLVNSKLGGTLDTTTFKSYDQLMQGCLVTGAYCIIDIHNYARWNGKTIGSSGGPTNDDFAGLWKQLAAKYAKEERVVMGLMNEPHEMPSLNSWAGSVQAAVTAIRSAGATSQMILLPGDGYTGASTFVSGGSAAALAGVTNPDGSTTNLIFEVHQYLDQDGSGTTSNCVKKSDVLAPLRNWLRSANRQALLAETGGGSDSASCITNVCDVLDFLNTNSEQFLGYLGWGAGSFASTYVLSLTPDGGKDVPLMEKCFAAKFGGGAGTGTTPTLPGSGSSAAAPPASSSPPTAGSPLPSTLSTSTTPASSTPAGQVPPSTNTHTPTSTPTSLSPLALPSSTNNGGLYGLNYGTQQASKQQAPSDSGVDVGWEQDDCDAEWEDVPAPAPAPSTVVTKRNGKVRLEWGDEIEL